MSDSTLKPRNWHGWLTFQNRNVGVGPYWSAILSHRIKQKKATNIVVTAEPGQGKSYISVDIARAQEGLTASGKDRFKLDQVVFRYRSYMHLVNYLAMGKIIVFDEPSYSMGKRDWFKEVNKALVLTIESQRFKVHPLIIPIINKALLDKTIRAYLIQFQIHVVDRGRARVYRIMPSQHEEKVYRYHICNLEYTMFDWDLCQRDSCLDCPKLSPEDPKDECQLFRARYERKKALIQGERYQQAEDMAAGRESKQYTDDQLAKMLYAIRERYVDDEGKIDVKLLRIVGRRELGVRIGHVRAYTIAKLLVYDHPQEFIE